MNETLCKIFIAYLILGSTKLLSQGGLLIEKYTIVFEGNYKKESVEIIADDSIVYKGVITSENPDIIFMAGSVTLDKIPRDLEIIINCKKIKFQCNPSKKYLYVRKKKFRKYILEDSLVERRYR